jgi:uncharacterized membrane protein
MLKRTFTKLISYFFQGLLYIAPIGITVYVLIFCFNFIDNLLPIDKKVPGLGVVAIIIILTTLGFIGRSFLAKPVFKLVEGIILKAPLIELIYSSLKDFLSAFVGKEKKFNQPVLVKINKVSNLEKIGFLTQKDMTDFGIKDKVAVYFPLSYNFSGELYIVPTEDITFLDLPAADVMKFIVSGGVSKINN